MLGRRARVAIPAALMVLSAVVPVAVARAQSPVKTCTTLAEDGQRLRAAGRLIDAREKLMACSAAECPQVVRSDCAQWASEVLAATPTLVIDAKDGRGNDVADAKVFVDDQLVAERIDGRPIAVDPGSRRIRVERSDGVSAEQSIVAKENAKAREVRIVLGAPRSSDDEPNGAELASGGWGPLHFAGVALIAVGAVGITYGAVAFVSYTSDEASIREKFDAAAASVDADGCTTDAPVRDPGSACATKVATREDLRRQYNENEDEANARRPLWLAAGIGGALLVAGGITMFVLAPKTKSPAVRGGPIVTPHFAGMTLGGAF